MSNMHSDKQTAIFSQEFQVHTGPSIDTWGIFSCMTKRLRREIAGVSLLSFCILKFNN